MILRFIIHIVEKRFDFLTTMGNDNVLSPKNTLKNNEDRSRRCSDDDYGDHPAGSKKLKRRKSMSGGSEDLVFRKNVVSEKERRVKMKDKYSASSSRSSFMAQRSSPAIPLVPPPSSGGYRRVSFLERSLFPGIKPDVIIPVPSPKEEKSKTAQLTIFYAGIINVYDEVPVNRAQAVMLLASQSSASHPAIKDITKADLVVKPVPLSQSPSLYKTREDLPIARRQSLRRFLDKRRDRILKQTLPRDR